MKKNNTVLLFDNGFAIYKQLLKTMVEKRMITGGIKA